jgi:hypothetical protein
MIPRLHLPLIEPEDVVRHLGHQERHWKVGRSAHALTHVWAKENGLPRSIRSILQAHPTFRSAELIDGFLERQVDLGSAGRPSQTDLLAVIGLDKHIAIVAVEGKAGEPFGDVVSKWLDGSDTKTKRLQGLCKTLGLSVEQAKPLRYQLLHRTASAIYEAKRYRTDLAGVLVHNFAADQIGYPDFCAFVATLGVKESKAGVLCGPVTADGVSVYLGWVNDRTPLDATPSGYLIDLRNYASRLSQWCDRVRVWCDARQSHT